MRKAVQQTLGRPLPIARIGAHLDQFARERQPLRIHAQFTRQPVADRNHTCRQVRTAPFKRRDLAAERYVLIPEFAKRNSLLGRRIVEIRSARLRRLDQVLDRARGIVKRVRVAQPGKPQAERQPLEGIGAALPLGFDLALRDHLSCQAFDAVSAIGGDRQLDLIALGQFAVVSCALRCQSLVETPPLIFKFFGACCDELRFHVSDVAA